MSTTYAKTLFLVRQFVKLWFSLVEQCFLLISLFIDFNDDIVE